MVVIAVGYSIRIVGSVIGAGIGDALIFQRIICRSVESNAKSHFINRLDNHSQLEVISCAKCVKAIYDAIVCFAGGLSSGIFDSVAVGFKFFDYSICDGFTIICGRFIVEIGYPEAHTPIYHIRNIASEVDVELIYPTGFMSLKLATDG